MASNARCVFFLFLAFSFCLQTHARDSKSFSKLTKESISSSPTQAPTLAPSPSPEPEVIEHGYGLYGQEPYKNYEYPPTTTNPTKSEKFDDGDEFVRKNNFKEFGMGYSNENSDGDENTKGNGYGNGNEKVGMSDTRNLENGKYYYDVGHDAKDEGSFFNGNQNGNGNGKGNVYNSEKQGMSDTRFLENGKYFYDINDGVKEGKNSHFNTNNYENENENVNFEAVEEENSGDFNSNNYENDNENENQYYYDAKNEHGFEDVGFHSKNNVEYANTYHGNGNGNGNENNEYEREGRRGYNNYVGNNEFHVNEGRGGYNGGSPKKFPNEYDTMEEYDREQGYIDVP